MKAFRVWMPFWHGWMQHPEMSEQQKSDPWKIQSRRGHSEESEEMSPSEIDVMFQKILALAFQKFCTSQWGLIQNQETEFKDESHGGELQSITHSEKGVGCSLHERHTHGMHLNLKRCVTTWRRRWPDMTDPGFTLRW